MPVSGGLLKILYTVGRMQQRGIYYWGDNGTNCHKNTFGKGEQLCLKFMI